MQVGSRLEVWNGTKSKTSGGLVKSDLKMNRKGKIVSKKVSEQATKRNLKRKPKVKRKKTWYKY